RDLGVGLQGGDAVQARLDRRQAGRLDRRLVHAGGEEIADLLLHAAGRPLAVGGGLGDLVLHFQRTLAEHGEGAPGGAVARHRVGGQPLAVDEAVEVLAGADRGIQILGAQGNRLHRHRREVDLQLRGRGGGGVFGGGLAGGQAGADGGGQGEGREAEAGHGGTRGFGTDRRG